MSRTVFTLKIDTEERLALEKLSRTEGRPINQLVNEAIKGYLREWDRKKGSLGTNLADLRDHRKRDPEFENAIDEFVHAEASLEDPIEGDLVERTVFGPVQRKIREILDV